MRKRKIIVSLILSFGLFVNLSSTFDNQVPAKITNIVTFEDDPIDGKH